MKFFVPDTLENISETTYETLVKLAHEQLRTPISSKRIYRLEYLHDKRLKTIQVGEAHPDHQRYTILAILESQPHIVMTRAADGKPGPTIMVASNEITAVTEFGT